jgi:hypothetical protein
MIMIGGLEDLIRKHLDVANLDERVRRVNRLREVISECSPFRDEPVDLVQWVPADTVQANDYNPNSVAPR